MVWRRGAAAVAVGIGLSGCGTVGERLPEDSEAVSNLGQVSVLLDNLETELRIAALHTGFALKKRNDLKWIQREVKLARHAVDPASEPAGPGLGLGVFSAAKALDTAMSAVGRAKGLAEQNRARAARVRVVTENLTEWATDVMRLSADILAATGNPEDAAGRAATVNTLLERMLVGTDTDGDGTIATIRHEGGLAQAADELHGRRGR